MSNKNTQSVKILGFGKRLHEAFNFAKNVVIAEKLEVSEPAVGNYIGDRIPKLPILLRIVDLTECSLDWLLLDKKPKFEIEDFGGRYKFSESQIESLKEIAEQQKLTLDEVIALGAKNALGNQGLIDSEEEIKLIESLLPQSSYTNEQRARIRLTKESLKDETVKKEIWKMIEPEIRKLFQDELKKEMDLTDSQELSRKSERRMILKKEKKTDKKTG